MSETIKEFSNIKEINKFLREELGGRELIKIPNPKHDPEIEKRNSYIQTQIDQFKKKWDEGYKIVAIKKKCPCGNIFWEPYIKAVKEDDPEYIEAKSGKLGESICGTCYGLSHRMRELGMEKLFNEGVMISVWEAKKGHIIIKKGNKLEDFNGDVKHLFDIGYTARVVAFEPQEGHDAAESKWQEQQKEIEKVHKQLAEERAKIIEEEKKNANANKGK